jgi:hypothetical protein
MQKGKGACSRERRGFISSTSTEPKKAKKEKTLDDSWPSVDLEALFELAQALVLAMAVVFL